MKCVQKSMMALCTAVMLMSSLTFAQKASQAELPSSYDFDYIYTLKMTHKKGDIEFDYYLKKDAAYFGFDTAKMSGSKSDVGMFMVMDNQLGVNAMFMDMMGKKVVQKSKLKLSDFTDDSQNDNFEFSKIDKKTIMGYECQGFVGENDKSKVTMYITDQAPVSFVQIWGTNDKLPKGFNPEWLETYSENGLMMEMIYVDKKKSKNNTTMICTNLESTSKSIDTSEYGSMLGAFGGN